MKKQEEWRDCWREYACSQGAQYSTMTDVLASYFDEASGDDEALRVGNEAIVTVADQPRQAPSFAKVDENLKQ